MLPAGEAPKDHQRIDGKVEGAAGAVKDLQRALHQIGGVRAQRAAPLAVDTGDLAVGQADGEQIVQAEDLGLSRIQRRFPAAAVGGQLDDGVHAVHIAAGPLGGLRIGRGRGGGGTRRAAAAQQQREHEQQGHDCLVILSFHL